MSIRLIRVSKELNVGINSLVEFLDKKGIQIEANPNAKINDEHHEMLLIEFGKDKNVKKTVDKQREKQLSKDKKETVAIEGYDIPDEEQKQSEEKISTPTTNLSDDIKPQLKILGTIDLDNLKAKPKKKDIEQKHEEKKQEIAPSKLVEKDVEKKEKVDSVELVEKETQAIKEKSEEKKEESKLQTASKKEDEPKSEQIGRAHV